MENVMIRTTNTNTLGHHLDHTRIKLQLLVVKLTLLKDYLSFGLGLVQGLLIQVEQDYTKIILPKDL